MPSNNAGRNKERKMSYRTIEVKIDNRALPLGVYRAVRREKVRTGFLMQDTGRIIKKVTVQYGMGVHGEGATLKAAVADFQARWSFFCANRHDIVIGRVEMV